MYVVKDHAMIATKYGTLFFAACTLSCLNNIVNLIKYKKIAAIIHHKSGDIIQLATIFDIVGHETALIPNAATHAHITHHTIECVVETGALK